MLHHIMAGGKYPGAPGFLASSGEIVIPAAVHDKARSLCTAPDPHAAAASMQW